MQKLSSNEIKCELLEMLKILNDFLQKNDIKYSITSGTLLGAIRHNGFIPWDDDIDISMLRPEYNKLVSILKKNNNIDNSLHGIGFELGNANIPFIKIINPKICTEETVLNDIVDKGFLWIDIFPMDGVPFFSKIYTKYIFDYLRRIYTTKRIAVEFPELISNQKKTRLQRIINKIDYYKIIKFYIKSCSRFDVKKCKLVCDYTWGNTIIPKTIMMELRKYTFQNVECMGLKESDFYLKTLYGNYMELPPIEKRVNHGLKAWYID